MLVHCICAHDARDCGSRFFEQICCDSRINEQFFGMAQSTSPDFFGGVENSRADWPATTVY